MKELNLCKTLLNYLLNDYFCHLSSVRSSHPKHWKKPVSRTVVWPLHQPSTEVHEQLHRFEEDDFLNASTLPVGQVVCLKPCMTISVFQIWGLKCVFYILHSASTTRIFHDISWIHLKKESCFPRFSTRETWACFPGEGGGGGKKRQLKASFPTAILYLVKLHDSSFLEILQWYHEVHFLLAPSRFRLLSIQGIQFSESSLISNAAMFHSALHT